jgi:hypothetical protein
LRLRPMWGRRKRWCEITTQSRSEGGRGSSRRIDAVRHVRLERLRARKQQGKQPGDIAWAFAWPRASGARTGRQNRGEERCGSHGALQRASGVPAGLTGADNGVCGGYGRSTRLWPANPAVATACAGLFAGAQKASARTASGAKCGLAVGQGWGYPRGALQRSLSPRGRSSRAARGAPGPRCSRSRSAAPPADAARSAPGFPRKSRRCLPRSA